MLWRNKKIDFLEILLLCFRHFQKVVFCLVLYTEVNLQTFVIVQKSEGEVTWRQIFNVTLVHFFLNFSQYCCEISIIQIQQRKVKKNIFLDKNSKKISLL